MRLFTLRSFSLDDGSTLDTTEAQWLVLDYLLSTQQNRLSTNNDTHVQRSMKDRRRESPPIVATYFKFFHQEI